MAEITLTGIAPFPQANGYVADGTVLRVWYSRNFQASDTTDVQGGNGSTGFYKSIACTVTSGNVTCPSFTLQTTIDANDPAPQSIQCFARLYSNNTPKDWLFSGAGTPTGWIIYNPTPATSLTFAQLQILNQAPYLANPPQTFLTTAQILALLEQTAGDFDLANATRFGITKLSVDPVSALNPIAVGDNDPRISSQFNITTYGASTTGTAAANATAITAAATAANLVGGSVVVPLGTFPTNSATISAPLIFDGAGSILRPATGQTVTITKSVTADASQHFSNVAASQGTISFLGNYALQDVYPEWWGASPSASAATNTPLIQAAQRAAFGNGNRTNASGLWVYNRILRFSGIYDINDEIKCWSMIGFRWEGTNKFNAGLRQTATNKRIIDGQSVAYGLFFNLAFLTSASQNVPLIDIDWNGTDTPSDIKTQQVTFDEFTLTGNSDGGVGYIGIQNAKSGGGAQGDNVYLTHFTITGFSQAGYQIGGGTDGTPSAFAFNAILNTIGPGDFQSCPQYAIASYGGSYVTDGVVSFENQSLNGVGLPTQTGADNYIYAPQNPCELANCRSEGLRFVQGTNAVLRNIEMSPYGDAWYSAGGDSLSGTIAFEDELVTGTVTGGDGKLYKVTAAPSGPTEAARDCVAPFQTSPPTTTTFNGSGAAYTLNQWAGHWVKVTFPNCFVQYSEILSNTITNVITLVDPIFQPGDASPAQDCGTHTTYEIFTNAGDPFPRWSGLPLSDATGGSLTTIVKAGAGWGVNDFVGFRASIVAGAGKYQYGVITGNTADTITVTAWLTDYELEVLPAYGIAAPDATSDFVVEPDWGTQTSDGVIEWELFDFKVIDGNPVDSNFFMGSIDGFSGSQGGTFKVNIKNSTLQNMRVTRSDWSTGSTGMDDVIVNPSLHHILVNRLVNSSDDIGIPWTFPRNGGPATLGPGVTQRTQGTEWIMFQAGETGGGPNYPDVGCGRGDDQFGNTTANKDILAVQGKLGKKTARGTDQAGSALVVQGGLSTGNVAGAAIEFWTGNAGSSGETPNTPTKKASINATGQFVSELTTGTAPLVTVSTTKVDNLNADLLDGSDWTTTPSLTPAAAGLRSLGSAAKPYRFVVLGNAANQSTTLSSNAASNRNATLPDADIVIPIITQQVTIAGPSTARTYTFPDAAATIARTDAGQTFTGGQIFSTALQVAATGKLALAPKTGQTYSNAMTIDVTISSQVLAVSFTTSATSTWTPSAAGSAGDILVLVTEADGSGTVTVTFAATFHSSGTQATTASHFSTITFLSDGTRWLEVSRVTALT